MGRRRSGACVCIPYRCGIAAFGQKGYLCGKHHGMMKITSAGFAFSSGRISQIPDDGLPEFAFIGRSNVGKSSLINMLTDNGFGHAGEDETDKSFPDKRAVVSRRFARLRVCESLQERPEGIREADNGLRHEGEEDVVSLRVGRFAPCPHADRPRFHADARTGGRTVRASA